MSGALTGLFGGSEQICCPFFYKIGCCRHGSNCSRKHEAPTSSKTVLLSNHYQSSFVKASDSNQFEFDATEDSKNFETYFQAYFTELSKYGEIDEIKICINTSDHMRGNVFCKFFSDASAARDALNGVEFLGRTIQASLSHVEDFNEAGCRLHASGECQRGGFCNFMHLREPSDKLLRDVKEYQAQLMRLQGREPHHKPSSTFASSDGAESDSLIEKTNALNLN